MPPRIAPVIQPRLSPIALRYIANQEKEGNQELLEADYDQMLFELENPEIATKINNENLAKRSKTLDNIRNALNKKGGFFDD